MANEKRKGRIGRWFKEMGSELKKVIWAKPRAVIKQTGVVFAVVGFFIIAVWLIDLGLSFAYEQLVNYLV